MVERMQQVGDFGVDWNRFGHMVSLHHYELTRLSSCSTFLLTDPTPSSASYRIEKTCQDPDDRSAKTDR